MKRYYGFFPIEFFFFWYWDKDNLSCVPSVQKQLDKIVDHLKDVSCKYRTKTHIYDIYVESTFVKFNLALHICNDGLSLTKVEEEKIGPSRVHAPAQRSGPYTRNYFSSSLLSLSELSARSRLGLWLADDFKGKDPHWLLGGKWNIGPSLVQALPWLVLEMPGKLSDHYLCRYQ